MTSICNPKSKNKKSFHNKKQILEKMEKSPSRWSGLIRPVRVAIIMVPVALVIWLIYFAATHGWIPGLHSDASKSIDKANIQSEAVNENSFSTKLPVPNIDELEFANTSGHTQIRLMQYTWFGNAGLFAANGGLRTMKGTLMDKAGIDFRLRTDNITDDMKAQQMAFVAAYAKAGPTSNPDVGFQLVTLMGDGVTSYVPAMNKNIEKAYGPQYKLKVFGIFGFSVGEDCGIGPEEWKDISKMKGAVISAVIGDGDYDVMVRKYSGDNGMKINPDPTSYDPEAINFVPAQDGDFMKAATDAITGRTVKLKEKDKNGNFTGKTIEKVIQGAATWFPGDRLIFQKTNLVKLVSTSEYPNQMATVVVGSDLWLKNNSDAVVKFLSAALTATNQIKQYPEWHKYAAALAPKVFLTPGSVATETAEDWEKFTQPNGATMKNTAGVEVSAGGTQMANLADNLKYFGMGGRNSVYKSVFDYVNNQILIKLNPANFKGEVGSVVQYEDAVDTTYLSKVKIDAGQTEQVDYTKNKGKVIGKRTWKIEFESNSYTFTPEAETSLKELFDLVNTASQNANLSIVGYTDNTGNPDKNIVLSLKRAKAVKQWLIDHSKQSFTSEKFSTDGKGGEDPVGSNATSEGRQQNRRVVITLIE